MSRSANHFFAGAGASGPANYIEDVFSTYLYVGNNTNPRDIVNNIDLSGEGGLVWTKLRNTAEPYLLVDTDRGATKGLGSASTAGQDTANHLTVFNSNGYRVTNQTVVNGLDTNNYVSWTFRKQPKFFDIVTYTGNGVALRDISHALGSRPGFVAIKRTDSTGNWFVAAWRGNTFLVGTDALPFGFNSSNGYNLQNGAAATSTTFDPNEVTISSNYGVTPSAANINGATYVAYLFAHNSGGFGETGSDNVISCGTFSTNASGLATVNLGYEPQFLLMKAFDASSWWIFDTMRNWSKSGYDELNPNLSAAEGNSSSTNFSPTATGFEFLGNEYGSSRDFVYMAIRRGPMKVPTVGTSVFSPKAYNGTGTTTIQTLSTNFPVDLYLFRSRSDLSQPRIGTRLTGSPKTLLTALTNAEGSLGGGNGVYNDIGFASNIGIGVTGDWNNPSSPSYSPYILEAFRRAPGFMDVVCYTGTGTDNRQITHNLGVAPELIINKNRGAAWPWWVGGSVLGSTRSGMFLNTTQAIQNNPQPNAFSTDGAAFTSSYFLVSSVSAYPPNANGYANIAYLFATCPGVSKVGSYTGTGTTLQIDCGFTTGARFVLIKRSDSTGSWYVWDTARGIIAGNDPYFLLTTDAAEVTNTDYIDTYSPGFELSSTAPADLNANGGTYIFLAIA